VCHFKYPGEGVGWVRVKPTFFGWKQLVKILFKGIFIIKIKNLFLAIKRE
jgi:hypothetical protein